MISPIFQELSGKFPSIKFYKVDVDENNDISQIAGVRAVSIPLIKFVVVALTFGLDAHIHCLQRG